ncbi:MAG: hypothetical protein ACK5KP_03225 [Paludibacteraceae bacterium]
MKKINILKRITFVAALLIGLASCEKHDFFDEKLITGKVGPQAYWEVGSSTISAGTQVPFVVQYYSTESEIDYSEVWYNISETVSKSVSSPWMSTFTYSITSTVTEEKRIPQKIETYPHTLAVWSDSLHAYTFNGEFPVSGTLSPFQWVKPEIFEPEKMDNYFGVGFMQQFKDSLYTLMKFADFQKMMLGMGLIDDFKVYTDSTFDANSNTYVYHFPKDAAGNTPVPDELKTMYNSIDFEQLIENSANNNYEVEYRRTYFIDAILRVYDKEGVYGTTLSKTININ